VLLDSVGKKIRELDSIVSALGLSDRVKTSAARAEAFARTEGHRYSVVVVRAVSELPALVELASPLLVKEGLLVCLKGSPSAVEVRRGNEVALMTGMSLEYEREFELPEQAGHRTVLCYRKKTVSIVKLPRREGLAQHAPLA
jgi:16S rRNA (guanine527-N7)-methyltransferase